MTDPVRAAAANLVASAEEENAQRVTAGSDFFTRDLAAVRATRLHALAKALDVPPPEGIEEAPLAQMARHRLAQTVQGMAGPMPPADLRDAAIAVAALGAAIEDLEEQDGRVYVHVGAVRQWVGNLLDLVALVGEPPDGTAADAERAYWSAVEGAVLELADLLPDTEQPAVPTSMNDERPGPGGGLFGHLADAEEARSRLVLERDDAHRRARIEVEEAKRDLGERAARARSRIEQAIRADDANLSRATIEELRAAVEALEGPRA